MRASLLVFLSFTALIVACGGVVAPGGGSASETPKPGEPCTTCTGGATLEARVCPDGTALGRECLGRADGTCGYDFPACPAGGVDGGAPAVDGSAGVNATCGEGRPGCAAGLYCRFTTDTACGTLGTGLCALTPAGCPDIFDPVCGCDGKTYGNECEASARRSSVAAKGECPLQIGAACGTRGIRGKCVGASFCKYEIADVCGAADAAGTCTKVPSVCGKNLQPVCGCDKVDYANPCEAERAAMSVASEGECP